jgi:hypothetical protein
MNRKDFFIVAGMRDCYNVDTENGAKVGSGGYEEGDAVKKKQLILCIAAILTAAVFLHISVQRKYTFTLAGSDGGLKSEQIQPLFGTVKVSGDCDTSVLFTDVETGERYEIGYITPGAPEKIRLEKGRWYTAAGAGNLTIGPVRVRIE